MRYYLLIVLVLVFGCSSQNSKKKMLSKKELVSVLVDLHISDALSTDYVLNSSVSKLDSTTVYSAVMKKHQTNLESFNATMQWYTARPDKLAEIYDEVFGELTKKQQGYENQMELFNSPASQEIYISKVIRPIFGDTAKLPEPMILETKGKGTYLITVQIRMLPDDKSINPRVLVYFCKNEDDNNPKDRESITDSPVLKSNYMSEFQFSGELKDESYKYIKIIAPKVDNPDQNYPKNLHLSAIRVFKYAPPVKKEVEPKKK
jgi:hypothetical protein